MDRGVLSALPRIARALLAGCAAGPVAPGAAMPADPAPLYATPSTPKSDKLRPPAAKPASMAAATAERVETIIGTPWPPGGQPPMASPSTNAPQKPEADAAGSSPPATGRSESPPAIAASAPEEDDGEPGAILWSKKTAALPGVMSDAAPGDRAGRGSTELAVPLREGAYFLGEIGLRLAPGGAASLAKDRLVQIAAPLLRAETLDRLKSLPDAEGYLPLPLLKENGFDLAFDAAKVEVQFTPTAEQRARSRISASGGAGADEPPPAGTIAAPAILAGYLNMRAGADYASAPFGEEDGTIGARFAFDGAIRWADIVLESAATLEMDGGFVRGATRFVHDRPEQALRFAAGDISPLRTDLQGGADLLGVSVEKSYQKLRPGTNIRPTGGRSFRIERPSRVDVSVNGHVVQRMHLRPGEYDLADLPLAIGVNEVSLLIEDDVGEKRTLDFTVFSGRALLAPGISEWALSAGIAARPDVGARDRASFYGDRDYDAAIPALTGFYERGLTPDLTGNVHLQADPRAVMGGAGAAFQTRIGFWAADAALSQSAGDGAGYAAALGYELANIEGPDGIARSFRLSANYRSAAFAALDLAPAKNGDMLDVSAAYSQALLWEVTGSISASYGTGTSAYGDRYGTQISLIRAFGPAVSAGISAGYEEHCEGEAEHGEDGFIASIRLSYRADERSSIDAGHDLAGQRSHLGYRYQQGSGVGSWNGRLELEREGAGGRGGSEDYVVGAGLGYIGNRAEITASQHTGLAGLDGTRIDQRTSITGGTALAFADGRLAVGRPVSDGFAIVAPHDNLAGSKVSVGASAGAERGGSGLLGPALVSDMAPYLPARLPYDVSNLPVGYDLGAGSFALLPAYKSGYRLTVGSDYTVSAVGALLDAGGEPVALLTGTAQEEGVTDGPKVTVFTNRAGRFGAQGLRPGRWVLEMATEPPSRYVIDIPEKAVGLVRLDVLKPVEAAR